MTSRCDAGRYRWFADLAQRTPEPIGETVHAFGDHGLALFAVLTPFARWRPGTSARTAGVLTTPPAVLAA